MDDYLIDKQGRVFTSDGRVHPDDIRNMLTVLATPELLSMFSESEINLIKLSTRAGILFGARKSMYQVRDGALFTSDNMEMGSQLKFTPQNSHKR